MSGAAVGFAGVWAGVCTAACAVVWADPSTCVTPAAQATCWRNARRPEPLRLLMEYRYHKRIAMRSARRGLEYDESWLTGTECVRRLAGLAKPRTSVCQNHTAHRKRLGALFLTLVGLTLAGQNCR